MSMQESTIYQCGTTNQRRNLSAEDRIVIWASENGTYTICTSVSANEHCLSGGDSLDYWSDMVKTLTAIIDHHWTKRLFVTYRPMAAHPLLGSHRCMWSLTMVLSMMYRLSRVFRQGNLESSKTQIQSEHLPNTLWWSVVLQLLVCLEMFGVTTTRENRWQRQKRWRKLRNDPRLLTKGHLQATAENLELMIQLLLIHVERFPLHTTQPFFHASYSWKTKIQGLHTHHVNACSQGSAVVVCTWCLVDIPSTR